jgi:uncharacterized membrane protein
MFDEKPPMPLGQELMIHALTLTLTALAFVASFVIWRLTLETLFFTLFDDQFVAHLVYLSTMVALMFGVVLVMLLGEPWLKRARARGWLWQRFARAAGALVLFGLVGYVLDRVLRGV